MADNFLIPDPLTTLDRPYRLIAVLAIVGGGVLFGSTLAGTDRLAFRDVGHFYAPLYSYLGERTASGQLPLWNPLDHTGIPVAGETTTAMFYPPRLVFALPLPSSVAMAVYIVVHLLLAAWAAGWTAGEAGCVGIGKLYAASAYTLACPVVFLHCNPPFLVGAAWLPLALGLGLRLMQTKSRYGIAAAAFSFAMPVLAGDPQTPIHVAVLLAVVWAARWMPKWRAESHRMAGVGPHALPLLLAIGFAILLALPQVAASLDWARHSARRFESPTGVYHFSVAPWHWFDLLIPTANGELFPQFQRLSVLVPSDSRVWSVSLYGGVLTLLLCMMRYARRERWSVWEWVAPVGILMAMGRFGPVWLLQCLAGWAGADADGFLMQLDPASWSPYWVLEHLLPGYDSFRYPAKWLPFVSLGMAVIAARQLEFVLSTRRPPFRSLATLSIVLAIVSLPLAVATLRSELLQHLPLGDFADDYWGPLDRQAGLRSLAFSLRHAAWVAAVGAILFWAIHHQRPRPWRYSGIAFCVLMFADLLIVNVPLIAKVNRQQEAEWKKHSPTLKLADSPLQSFLRTGEQAPHVWQRTSVQSRITEVAASERNSLQGRWHLDERQRVFNSATSIISQRYQSCADASVRFTAPMTQQEQNQFWIQFAEYWGLTAYLHTSPEAAATTLSDGRPARLMDTRVIPLPQSSPPVRWHPRWDTIGPATIVTQDAWMQHFHSILQDAAATPPMVETAKRLPIAPEHPQQPVEQIAKLNIKQAPVPQISMAEAESLRLTIQTSAAGLLTRRTFQDGHWHCRIRPVTERNRPGDWQTAEVYPVDYLAQGVLLPAGDWELQFWYRPWWLLPTLLAALIGWLLLAAIALRQPQMRLSAAGRANSVQRRA